MLPDSAVTPTLALPAFTVISVTLPVPAYSAMSPLRLLVVVPVPIVIARPATMSIVWPLALAVMSAFCSTLPAALMLVAPTLLLTLAPSLMSLLEPSATSACNSRLPAALIAPPVARLSSEPPVISTKLPALLRSLCSVPSSVAVSVEPSRPTMFTLILFSVPSFKALASLRYMPTPTALPALTAASRLTLVSRGLLALPTPRPVTPAPVATMRNWLAVTSTSVVPLSLMLCALRLTLPAVLSAPTLNVVPAT